MTDTPYPFTVLVAADGSPRGFCERAHDGSWRVHYGAKVAGFKPGWHFFTDDELADLGWHVETL